jgi:hypothetical protein
MRSLRQRLRRACTGLALIVLAAVVAVVGASSASAASSALCATPTCEPTGIYPAKTPLAASLAEGTELKLLSSVGTVACKSSSIAGETTAEAGKPLPLKITKATFGTCNLGSTSCTVTTKTLPTSPSLKATGEGNGILDLKGAEVNFKCGFLINCTFENAFGPEETSGLQFEGGNPATFGIQGLALKEWGGFCPETSILDVSYTLTEPAPAYAVESEGQTLFCVTPTCAPSIYPAETAIAASLQKGVPLQLLTNLGTIKCESSTIAGETVAEEGEPLPLKISELSLGSCKVGETGCTATTAALPTSPSLKATGEDDGTLSLEGGEWTLKCGALIDCTFATPTLQFEGGSPASLSAKEVVPKFTKGALCPGASAFDVTYTLAEPAPAYLVET